MFLNISRINFSITFRSLTLFNNSFREIKNKFKKILTSLQVAKVSAS